MILVGVANTIAAISIIVSLLRSPNIKYLTTEDFYEFHVNPCICLYISYPAILHSNFNPSLYKICVSWIISINYQAVIHSLMHLHSVYYLGQGESKCFNIKIFKFFVIAQPNIEHNSGVKCLLATENIEYLIAKNKKKRFFRVELLSQQYG